MTEPKKTKTFGDLSDAEFHVIFQDELAIDPSIQKANSEIQKRVAEDVSKTLYDPLNPGKNFDNLPDSILLKIFHEFRKIELGRIAQVCKRWKRVVQDRSLWKEIDFRGNDHTLKEMWNVLQGCCTKWLKTLHLKGQLHAGPKQKSAWRKKNGPIDKTLTRIRKRSPHLRELTMSDMSVLKLRVKGLPKSLTSLSIVNSYIRPRWFSGLISRDRTPSRLANLTHLDLSESTKIDYEDIADITKLNCRLVSLKLKGLFRLKTPAAKLIAERMQSLEVLDIGGTRITFEGIYNIVEHLTGLVHLDLSAMIWMKNNETFPTYEACVEHIESFGMNSCGSNKLTDKFIENVSRLNKLRSLVLTDNYLLNHMVFVERIRHVLPECVIITCH